MNDHDADIEAISALMAECECGHLVMHGWHLKYGCQFEDCSCSLGAGGALLASDWLAERERAAAAKALAAVEALADEWERDMPAWRDPIDGPVTELRAVLAKYRNTTEKEGEAT